MAEGAKDVRLRSAYPDQPLRRSTDLAEAGPWAVRERRPVGLRRRRSAGGRDEERAWVSKGTGAGQPQLEGADTVIESRRVAHAVQAVQTEGPAPSTSMRA